MPPFFLWVAIEITKGVMKFDDFKIDLKKREDGDWVGNLPSYGELELKVRGIGNKDWARMEQKLIAAVPRQRRMNGLEPEDRLRINGILCRDCSLLDWRGILDQDGNPVPYSKELANRFLTDPQYEKLVEACLIAASVVAEQTKAEIEDDAKN